MEIKPKKINVSTPILESECITSEIKPTQILISEHKETDEINNFTTTIKQINSNLDTINILDNCDPISDIDKLKEKLTKLGIRFNTDPKVYQKRDYLFLICILYQSLIHLYESDPESVITTEWLNPHSDKRIPTEKLVKETIDQISVPKNISAFNNDVGYITSELDPTVPSWAKEESKPNYTAQEVGALPDTTIIPSKTSDLFNDLGFLTLHLNISGKADKIPIINKTSNATSSFIIDPNKMYMFGIRTSLTITLATPTDNTTVNEYMFLFTSGSTPTSLSVPSSIKWMKNPNIQTGKKYMVNIENNLGIIGEWDNE